MSLTSPKNRRRVESTQRMAGMQQGVARSRASWALRIATVVAFTAGSIWGGMAAKQWALTSPTFGLTKTRFSGLSRASRAELLKLSGLTVGQNLFSLDTAALERALAAHPWVRRVEVVRHLPGSLSVEVVEHVPSAIVALGDLYVLDEEGEPFKRLVAADAVDLPLVTGIDRERYMQDGSYARERFKAALEMARAYAATGPGQRERLSELRLEAEGFSLVTTAGQEIHLGAGDASAKLARLVRVRRELTARGLAAEVIHLDNRARPGWVAIKLSSSGSERTGSSTQ